MLWHLQHTNTCSANAVIANLETAVHPCLKRSSILDESGLARSSSRHLGADVVLQICQLFMAGRNLCFQCLYFWDSRLQHQTSSVMRPCLPGATATALLSHMQWL